MSHGFDSSFCLLNPFDRLGKTRNLPCLMVGVRGSGGTSAWQPHFCQCAFCSYVKIVACHHHCAQMTELLLGYWLIPVLCRYTILSLVSLQSSLGLARVKVGVRLFEVMDRCLLYRLVQTGAINICYM